MKANKRYAILTADDWEVLVDEDASFDAKLLREVKKRIAAAHREEASYAS